MSNQLQLKNLENLKDNLQDQLLHDLLGDTPIEPTPESLLELERAITAFESTHNMSSEQMMEKFDCDSFEENPELGKWAALYSSYRELKESA